MSKTKLIIFFNYSFLQYFDKTSWSYQNDPTQFEQANETSVQVDPTNSMHLELDESLNNDNNNDLKIDEYDRVVSRNRVISSDDEIVVENDPDLKPNELLIKNN